jgi:hypothetical protein
MVDGCKTFHQYFSYIVVVSFIGGGHWSIQRKPQTYHKSLNRRGREDKNKLKNRERKWKKKRRNNWNF